MKLSFQNHWSKNGDHYPDEVLGNTATENIFSLSKIKGDEYDKYIFGKTKPINELKNLWQICQYYKLKYNDILALNIKLYKEIDKREFDVTKMNEGDIVYLPKGTLSLQQNKSGDLESKNTVYVAWTMDDGPRQPFTQDMLDALGNIKKVTWFIMYDTFNKFGADKAKELYAKIIKNGGEIGIHSAHMTKNHCTFFPISQTEIDSGFQAHSNIEEAITAITQFKAFLTSIGIETKFVRPPYGLNSELQYYFKKQGFSSDTKPTHKELANSLISKKNVIDTISDATLKTKALKVKEDFDYFINSLKTLNLKIGVTNEVKNLDWDCESNGTTLTDNVTLKVSAKSRTKLEGGDGKFEKLADEVYSSKKDKYMVILGHDTTINNANEVKTDINQMEFYAKYCGNFSIKGNSLEKEYDKNSEETLKKTKTNGVKIIYVTMSEILKLKL